MYISNETVEFKKDNNPNIDSGNTLAVLFGKIKYFMDTITGSVLPDTTLAIAGDFLVLDSNKKPKWTTIPNAEDASF